MRIVTLLTPQQLPQASVLGRSIERHEPGCERDLLLIARPPGANAGGDSVALSSIADELELELDIETLIARHPADDLRTLLLPHVLRAFAKRTGSSVLHLPPTAWLTAPLDPVRAALEANGVALTPRTNADPPADGLQPTLEQTDALGRISDGVIAVDAGAAAGGFLVWWSGLVEETLGSLDGERPGARPEDRVWLSRMLELAPARFRTAVVDDPGFNVSQWNLHERSLEQTPEGIVVNGGFPLRMLDLAGFDPARPYRLSPIASRARVSRSPALRELCSTYAAELEGAGWGALDRRADVGRTLPNGLVYDDPLRSLHVLAESLGESFGDVFEDSGARAFTAWLQGPSPVGGGHGISRYVYYRVARERSDVLRAYPRPDGPEGAEYVAWVWAFGRDEMGIPELFMPPPPGTANGDSAARGGDRAAEPRNTRARRERDVPDPMASRGPAVRVSGYMGHALGLGAAARGYAEALAAAGVSVTTASVPLGHLTVPNGLGAGYGEHTFEDAGQVGDSHAAELIAVNADELPAFVERVGGSYFRGPRIGVWGWETNSIPARWSRAFELIDEIWVYSRFMAANLGAVAPVPVVALPPPVHAPAQAAAPVRLGVPEGFLFLFVFDYLSTIQRKNPVGLVEAFKCAFAPGEGPRLLLKTINAPLRPLAEEEVLWAVGDRDDIHVVDCSLSVAERDGLMEACDCYVSLHRSEGFGLTLAEAMAIGKPVIATRYSGNLDFMNERNSMLVDYEPTLVGPECEIYPADGEWAEPSIEHAARLMREIVDDRERAAALGAQARLDVAANLSPEVTGAAMRRRLEEALLRANSA
ncbi:MAG TPA: glycosyltransferase family 4 protein [Solirubrobacteraceae bacterium]|nr:glycosyltransferase family 4 protein [Solirubrobacteraceae bacterium]